MMFTRRPIMQLQSPLFPIRHFSTGDKPSKEYTINEEELFGEKKMQEAQKSIGEKLKAIKQQQ